MAGKCILRVNGAEYRVNPGDTLVDAGFAARVLIPHDCCAGQCDTCRVRVVAGAIDDQGTAEGDTVLACQARIAGDAEIVFEEVPIPSKRHGAVAAIHPLSPDILEVVVRLNSRFTYRPGQYVKVAFAGYPARDYSPTAYLDGRLEEGELVFHIKAYPNGIVSGALGRNIGLGHRVTVQGPYGHAFHRPGDTRLVLIASGTGFAPIWSIARAARLSEPHRPMVVVAGTRDPQNLYMAEAVAWLKEHDVGDIVLAASGAPAEGVSKGRPTDFLPELRPSDTVYVAGAPAMVEAVKDRAAQAGAACFADPFTFNATGASMFDRLRRLMQTPAREAAASPLSAPAAAPHRPLPPAATRNLRAVERAAPGEARRRESLWSRLLARS